MLTLFLTNEVRRSFSNFYSNVGSAHTMLSKLLRKAKAKFLMKQNGLFQHSNKKLKNGKKCCDSPKENNHRSLCLF